MWNFITFFSLYNFLPKTFRQNIFQILFNFSFSFRSVNDVVCRRLMRRLYKYTYYNNLNGSESRHQR